MKRRNISYFQKSKARKIMSNILNADLKTFLNASYQLCKSAVVKSHVYQTIQELENNTSYRLSA